MSIEIDALAEIYSTLKQHIPQKDRLEAAENLLGVLVDMLSDDELAEIVGSCAHLTKAYKEYASDFPDSSDEDDNYNSADDD